MSPALAGGFLTTEPPGKSCFLCLEENFGVTFLGSYSSYPYFQICWHKVVNILILLVFISLVISFLLILISAFSFWSVSPRHVSHFLGHTGPVLLCTWFLFVRSRRSSRFFFNLFILFYLFLAALGLFCCAWVFSSCGKRGATLHCSVWASHCSGFSCCGARALVARASVVLAHGLSSCGSQALECRLSSCGTWA